MTTEPLSVCCCKLVAPTKYAQPVEERLRFPEKMAVWFKGCLEYYSNKLMVMFGVKGTTTKYFNAL